LDLQQSAREATQALGERSLSLEARWSPSLNASLESQHSLFFF
jgi:hypothetical protein